VEADGNYYLFCHSRSFLSFLRKPICHSRPHLLFFVIPVPTYARINSGGNLSYSFVIPAKAGICNILINFLIKHYSFNLYSICFYNFVLLDSRSLFSCHSRESGNLFKAKILFNTKRPTPLRLR
jgi:hypothetical protein